MSTPPPSRATRYALELADWLEPRPGETVIDVGCGDGTVTVLLARRVAPNGRVLGVDPDPATVAQLGTRAGLLGLAANLMAAMGSAEGLEAVTRPWRPDAGCSAVFSSGALHFVADLDTLGLALAAMTRVLAGRGRLLVQLGGTGNAARLLEAADEQAESLGLPTAARGHGWTLPAAAQLEELASAAGLVEVKVERRSEPLQLDPVRARRLALSLARRHLAGLPAGLAASYLDALVAQVCPDGQPVEERLVRLLGRGRRPD